VSPEFDHYSALRTTANLTNANGDIQVSYRTDPWGEITNQEGSSVNRQVFTGQEHDEKTGLIYFGARFYDPDTARFINQDSYLGEIGTPPSLHRYLYAYGNPTVYFDQFGYESVSDKELRLAHEQKNAIARSKINQDMQAIAEKHSKMRSECTNCMSDAEAAAKGAEEERQAKFQAELTKALITLEANSGIGVGEYSVMVADRKRYAADVRSVAANTALAADIVSGFLNPIKGAHDTYLLVGGIPAMYNNFNAEVAYEVTKQLIIKARENPEVIAYGAAALAAIVACKAKCGAFKSGFDDLKVRNNRVFNSVSSPTGLKVGLDKSGVPIRWEYTVGQKGTRGTGYKNVEVGTGYHRGHVKSVNEGAGVNSIDDSFYNIIEQTSKVNLSNVKRFENWRVKNAQGSNIIVERLDNGFIRTTVPSKNIDVTYNPLSNTKFVNDWFLKGGTHE